jgi:hypothetical protein
MSGLGGRCAYRWHGLINDEAKAKKILYSEWFALFLSVGQILASLAQEAESAHAWCSSIDPLKVFNNRPLVKKNRFLTKNRHDREFTASR